MVQEIPHRIFLVPEVFEAILLELPIQNLLVNAQRVSHAWKTTIDSSSALQQALFFQSIPSASEQLYFNPLLQSAFPPWYRTSFGLFRGRAFAESIPWASSSDSRAAFLRADASWRKMLPCQPARNELEVVGKKNVKEGIFELNGRASCADGFRMGSLYDFGYDNLKKYVSSFWIQWDEAEGEGTVDGEGGSEARQRRGKMVIFTEHSYFKAGPNKPPDIGEEFRSDGYEELKLDMREERRSMWWHGGFANAPKGWNLR